MTQVLIYMYIPSKDAKILILVNTEIHILINIILVTQFAIYMYTPAQDPSRLCCVSVCTYMHICAYMRLCSYVRIRVFAYLRVCNIRVYISSLHCTYRIHVTRFVLHRYDT